jgi:malonate-semialdehyde dehydrogenase (acetylating)/methylmalonate-semialdehyde dehydrogenase
VLSVVRAKDYEEALRLPSEHEYGNGVAIFTRDGPDSIRFYTKTKTVTSRWPSGIKQGAEFVIPTMK